MNEYTEHIYSRNGLDIFREDKVYPEEHEYAGRVKGLAKFIEEAFPNKRFRIRCDGDNLCVCLKDSDNFSEANITEIEAIIDNYRL